MPRPYHGWWIRVSAMQQLQNMVTNRRTARVACTGTVWQKLIGCTWSYCIFSAFKDWRITKGLVAVTLDAVKLTGKNVMLLAFVYDPKASSTSQSISNDSSSSASRKKKSEVTFTVFCGPSSPAARIVHAEAWKGGEEMFKRKRLRAAFEKRDSDGSCSLEWWEVSAALASSSAWSRLTYALSHPFLNTSSSKH